MEALEIGFLHKLAFVSQSKRLLFFLPLLLLILAISYSETLMPATMWHAFTGFFEGSAFAFLLLNCLIVTIIASSKLEGANVGHKEEATRVESMRQIMEKGEEENVSGETSQSPSITNGYEYEGKDFVTAAWRSLKLEQGETVQRYVSDAMERERLHLAPHPSLAPRSACSLMKANKEEPINIVNGKKPIMRASRLACRGTNKAGLLPNKPLISDRGGSHAKPALEKSQKFNDNTGLNITDHLSLHAVEPAAAAMTHPSLEEVWAAIMLTKKSSDDRISNYMQAPDQCINASTYVNDNQALQAAAARSPPAAATDVRRPRAAAAPAPAAIKRTPLAAAAAAAEAQTAPNRPSDAPAAVIEKQEDADDHEHDSELEDLNRRAEEFIARFNHQMRLQHQESLQGKRRRRPCNHHMEYANHLQLPAPGLLVG